MFLSHIMVPARVPSKSKALINNIFRSFLEDSAPGNLATTIS